MTGLPAASAPACPRCGARTVEAARFCHACGQPLAELSAAAPRERRIVTVLFGDLSDFTAWAEDLDPERVGLVADRALAAMSDAVTEVGGHVDKLTGDGIMAVFGAPVAHEDDAERAVRAALAMQGAVGRLMRAEGGADRRLGLRVGLNTGEVIAGVQARLSYTVVGDAVNTAARLSDAAGVGQVWAGRDTALAAMEVASWRALPPLRLKGKRERVAAFELVGLRPEGDPHAGWAGEAGPGGHAPLVGREGELGTLVGRLIEAVEAQAPAGVAVTGEAGIGKTRLVEELGRFAAELPQLRQLWGKARPYGAQRSLGPVVDWVRAACGISEVDPAPVAADRVRRALEELAGQGAGGPFPAGTQEALLALVGAASRPGGPRESATPGAGRAIEPAAAAGLLLNRVARDGPLLLVADDLQWADAALLAALHELARGLRGPVLVVWIGRDDGAGRSWWPALAPAQRLALAPLDPRAAGRLLRHHLAGGELAPDSRELLVGRAQGNPFFLAELLRLLVDRGYLRQEGASWRLTRPVPLNVLPSGVHAVLTARVDELAPQAKTVLRDAAIAGVPFREELLAGLEPPELVAEGLRQLRERGIVAVATPGGRYTFRHELVRDVAYSAVPKRERARRHAALAVWAAGHPDAAAPEPDQFVAEQARQAVALATEMGLDGEPPLPDGRAAGARALGRLARAALDRADAARAEALYTDALELAGAALAPPRLARLRLGRAAARVAGHRGAAAEADLAAVAASADPVIRAGSLVVTGQVQRLRGEESAAMAAFVSAVAAASEAGADRITGEALRQLGLVHYLAGRLRQAEQRFTEALALAERIGDLRGTGWALQHLTWSATTRGAYRQAEESLRRAAVVFGELDDSAGLAWCAGTEAFVRLLQGRLREARTLARGVLPLGEAMGQRWGTAVCLTIDAFAAAELGELTVAREEAGSALDLFAELADSWGRSLALAARAFAERGAGDVPGAAALLEEAVRVAEGEGHPASRSLALCGLGYCELDRGRPDAARAAAERALELLPPLDLEPAAKVGAQVLLAQALRRLGDLDGGLALLEAAAATSDEPSLIFPRRQALAHLAGALHQAGETRRALDVACHAQQVPAQDVRSRVVALRVLAQCLASAGDAPAARFALREALALACGTEQVSERAATLAALESLPA